MNIPQNRSSALPARETPEKTAIILCGPPKVGKDTHSNKLSQYPNAITFNTGQSLKDLRKSDPENPDYAPIAQGGLVSDKVTLRAFQNWFKDIPAEKTVLILNGIPRNTEQLKLLVPFLLMKGVRIMVIWFTTPVKTCATRPNREDREEDAKLDVVQNRLNTYLAETLPMKSCLAGFDISVAQGNLLEINNEHLSESETAQQIKGFVGPVLPAEHAMPSTSVWDHREMALT